MFFREAGARGDQIGNQEAQQRLERAADCGDREPNKTQHRGGDHRTGNPSQSPALSDADNQLAARRTVVDNTPALSPRARTPQSLTRVRTKWRAFENNQKKSILRGGGPALLQFRIGTARGFLRPSQLHLLRNAAHCEAG